MCAATTAAGGVIQDLLESPHLTLELQGLLEQLPKQMDKVEGGGGWTGEQPAIRMVLCA